MYSAPLCLGEPCCFRAGSSDCIMTRDGIADASLIIQLQDRLSDYRNQIKAKAEQVVVERFKKLHSDDVNAIQDREKRIQFGTEWCNATAKDYKFIWQGYNKTNVSLSNFISFPLSYDTTGDA
jgi:hypothetical protein